jgi:acyl-CoA synthetase (AMP-forming)/AMP-acid ligase II
MLFDEYYKMPEKTAASFRGEWFSAGDMAKRDKDGFYEIIDRKDNLIITGGEHVYPSEVEKVIGSHHGVLDVAIIGLPDDKWGEIVTAIVIPKDPINPPLEEEISEYCKGKMAGFKRPKCMHFIAQEEMPRTGSGKILHRALRIRYTGTLD